MKARTLHIGASLALLLAGAVLPASAASVSNDCEVRPPQAEVPGSATTDQAPNEKTDDTLTERLATCGSVPDPPPVGDVDIVDPAPPVGDDMNIHPDAPAVRP